MQLLPKSENPTNTRTNIKSFQTKFLRNKHKTIEFVFLYPCKQMIYVYVK